jgi:hypothetical protein
VGGRLTLKTARACEKLLGISFYSREHFRFSLLFCHFEDSSERRECQAAKKTREMKERGKFDSDWPQQRELRKR